MSSNDKRYILYESVKTQKNVSGKFELHVNDML